MMNCRDRFVITVYLRAKAGCEEDLGSVLENTLRECAGQEGLLLYNLHRDKEDSSLFLLYGHFSSEASFRMHMDSDSIRNAFDVLVTLLENGTEVKVWSSLEAIGEKNG